MLQLGCNVTEWAQSFYLSRGIKNPDLDAYASTYPIGIPKLHLFETPRLVVATDAVKAAAEDSD